MKIQSIRGMNDLLPEHSATWQYVEATLSRLLASYSYKEIRFPILEKTDLFKRAVGEVTDIVEKEMYTFDDRNGESLTLRPEGTAGCVRFAEQNGLLFNQVQRLWYSGAMFRYERPQKGRYRQFDQIGAECFGMPGPDVDAELLLMNARIWRELGLDGDIRLELNSLGNPDARAKFKEKLAGYLQAYEQDLDEDSQRRLTTNPLRILDSKSSKTQEILQGAPVLSDFMDNDSKQHFEGLRVLLDDNGIAYEVNPNIVRGLDYYNETVFEWITTTLGSQGTVCGGGRYDGLVEQLGGKPSPGIGFAMGLDRLSLMLAEKMESLKEADVYLVSQGNAARATALRLAESLRDQLSGKKVIVHCGEGKFKSQMKKADASGADLALVLGEDEVAAGTVSIKSLREGGEQSTISQETLARYCLDYFSKEN